MSLTNNPGGSKGGSKPDDHDGFARPSAESLRLGYEPDGYHTGSVVSVPVLVVVFFVLAFGSTTALFMYFSKAPNDPAAHPMARERNQVELGDRLKRIGRGAEVDQPRLEPLVVRTGNSRAITRPTDPNGNNPPYVYPEDSRADADRTPELFRTGWADGGRTVAQVPLAAVLDGAAPKLFPFQDHGSRPTASTHLPTASNAGRGAEHAEAVMPRVHQVPATAPEAKKDEPKKDEAKKDEPKKDAKAPDAPKAPEPPKAPEKGEVKK
ncbi:hypothetical protein [Gemmata sp.]|uniref:hypothetical protein n=1 Tax=Gemmata sp. TaxID=1914242 RepID=UPI003F6E92B7